jgi:prepilin-type N-terminal cleavage/methylation domain-containing protein
MLRNTRGFTLTELLIVITIIGILAGLAIPRFTGQTEKARVAEAVGILSAMRRGQIAYFDANSKYLAIGRLGAPTSTDANLWAQLGMRPPTNTNFWSFSTFGGTGTGLFGSLSGRAVATRIGTPPGANPNAVNNISLSPDGSWTGAGVYAPGQPYAPAK